ncbi:hypothetical protein phiSA039_0003 [Staphylococcus phage phiSA039]|nr:hypothetical protein Biyabedamokiny2_00128 [Staphylococcus phage Biyabeda-mokiny_2]BBC69462.1 hypothetical protein phiSA039_0003 [Staphylococcus phage phiSA039]
MKIKDVIKQLQAVENKELELYVCDDQGNNIDILSITPYDSEEKHSVNNPLGINFK